MKHIIIPTNFSSCAENALVFAKECWDESNVKFTLLHATNCEQFDSATTRHTCLTDSKEQLDNALAYMRSSCQSKVDIAMYDGNMAYPPEEIVKPNDIVVLGTDGLNKNDQYLKATNTESFISNSKSAVFIVPNGVKFKRFQSILFATDLEHIDDQSKLDLYYELLETNRPKNHVVHINMDNHEPKAGEIIEHTFLKNRLAAYDTEFHEIIASRVDEGLFKFMQSYTVDLIVMISKHKGLIKNQYHHGITKKIAEFSKIPVLVLP